MDIDELFKKTKRLKTPDSLKTNLQAALNNEAKAEVRAGFFEKVADCFPSSRPIWSLAAIAAMALLAIRLLPGSEISSTSTHAENLAEARVMLTETLGPVFNYDNDTNSQLANSNGDSENTASFLERQVEEIFWVNGGGSDA